MELNECMSVEDIINWLIPDGNPTIDKTLQRAYHLGQLEGARKMQGACAVMVSRPLTQEEWDLNWTNEEHIRAINPEDVVK